MIDLWSSFMWTELECVAYKDNVRVRSFFSEGITASGARLHFAALILLPMTYQGSTRWIC
jgi:hypothetical protein